MSDCTKAGRVSYDIARPSLKKLYDLHGEPPWELHVPDGGVLPDEAVPFVGTLVWRGVRFERVREAE